MKFINLTPHAIILNDGTQFPPSGQIARVSQKWSTDGILNSILIKQEFGSIIDLPPAQEGVVYIVSAIVFSAAVAAGRGDVAAPATGHPETKRDNGQIVSVPYLIIP